MARPWSITKEMRVEIRKRWRSGEPQASIASSLAVSQAAVCYHCRGVELPEQIRNTRSGVTRLDKREAFRLRGLGYTLREIGNTFDVTESAVCHALSGMGGRA